MYQALYRQYRPKTFDEVLGQEHITTTLKNQIQRESIGHAYLFSGTKGTGKTSTAKIFSRAINCLNPKDGNPCNECEICKGILDESIIDVTEMDAASNRKIEDIRELKDKVVYPPSRTKYRVYIIDEVHMLTDPAFNALLKTLEEPPKHLVFILATTSMEKLPQTILSRCQIFSFKRISSRDIITNMEKICSKLNIPVEKRALELISRNSVGSMRDALSLLDQCLSYTNKELTYQDALDMLGIVNMDLLFSMVDDIQERNIEKVLYRINQIVQDGKDVNQFIGDLIYHYRNLLLIKVSSNLDGILDMDQETISTYQKQGEKFTVGDILKAIDRLNECENQAKKASQPRIILEMAAIELTNSQVEASCGEGTEKTKATAKDGHIQPDKVTPTITYRQEKDARKDPKELKPQASEKPYNNECKLSFQNLLKEWGGVLESIKEQNIRTHAFLKEGEPSSLEGNKLCIIYKQGYDFHKDSMLKPNNKEIAEKVISSYFGEDIKLDFIMEENAKESSNGDKKDMIKEIIDFFGEDIVEIE